MWLRLQKLENTGLVFKLYNSSSSGSWDVSFFQYIYTNRHGHVERYFNTIRSMTANPRLRHGRSLWCGPSSWRQPKLKRWYIWPCKFIKQLQWRCGPLLTQVSKTIYCIGKIFDKPCRFSLLYKIITVLTGTRREMNGAILVREVTTRNSLTKYVWKWLGVSTVLWPILIIRPSPKSFNVGVYTSFPSPGCVFPRCKMLGNCPTHPATLPRHLWRLHNQKC